MKVKTAELIGPALDWAVAKCEKLHIDLVRHTSDDQVRPVEVNPTTGEVLRLYQPSDYWSWDAEHAGLHPFPTAPRSARWASVPTL